MAPKKEKKPAEPPPPPSDWVPRAKSKEWMACDEKTVTHLRTGRADAVRGKALLARGTFRLTYEVTHTSSPDAQDLVVGVCDAAAWSAEESLEGLNDATTQLQLAFDEQTGTKWQTFGRHGHALAWGFEPKTGCLIVSPDVCAGRHSGAIQGRTLVESAVDDAGRPLKYAFPRKSTVVIECHMLELEEGRYQIQQRMVTSTLHPLNAGALRGADAVAPPAPPVTPTPRRTMAVSVNGGPFVEAGIGLPPAVFPWVMMTWQHDKVTLVGCEKFAPKIV